MVAYTRCYKAFRGLSLAAFSFGVVICPSGFTIDANSREQKVQEVPPPKYQTLSLGVTHLNERNPPNSSVFNLWFRQLLSPQVSYCETPNSERTSKNKQDKRKQDKTALSKSEFRPFTLQSVQKVSHNVNLYRFALPTPEHQTGLTVASCLVARAEVEGKNVTRPYTPVSLNHQKGHLDLMIKTYPKPGGLMSRHFAQLKPGDIMEMKGPFKKFEYKQNMVKRIGMIAGGTGITPMLQIIREILSNPEDNTEISLLFANVTEDDILLRDELEALQYLYPNFRTYYTLDKPPWSWKQGIGFVTEEMIRDNLPPPDDDTLILVCGPKGFVSHIAGSKGPRYSQGPLKGLLEELQYQPDQVFKF